MIFKTTFLLIQDFLQSEHYDLFYFLYLTCYLLIPLYHTENPMKITFEVIEEQCIKCHLCTLATELTITTRVMDSSSNKLSDSVKGKQTKVNIYTLNSATAVRSLAGCAVGYRSDVKLGGFRSQFEASRISSHNEEL